MSRAEGAQDRWIVAASRIQDVKAPSSVGSVEAGRGAAAHYLENYGNEFDLSFTFSRRSSREDVRCHGNSTNRSLDYFQLVAGSGGDASAGKSEEAQEAIPGPVTRLFVIMNRGISNLVQDLILVSNSPTNLAQ